MCDVLLPQGVNPIAVKYIYHMYQKREQSMIEVTWHNLLFLWLCSLSNFKKHDVSEASSGSFSGKEAYNLEYPLDQALVSQFDTIETVTC
jgi:hypothetical protein